LGFTLEDLQQSVKEYGIYLTKPDYWADTAYESPAEKAKRAKPQAKPLPTMQYLIVSTLI
jgi:hypothetical protein